jgi:Ser/Thr protein kinase RdoA (MazF antagonist)
MVGAPVALPSLAKRFEGVGELLSDRAATSGLSNHDRSILQHAVQLVAPDAIGSAVLHAEPHDGNQLIRDGSTIYVDFEAACVGPIEWATCVAVACWRHVSARPGDVEMQWHADHHLSRVREQVG